MKIYIVKGEHFRIPAVPSTAHNDLRQAHGEAANLVALLWKDLADDGGDGFEVTPDNWQEALKSAQLQRVMDEQGLDEAPEMDGPELIEASEMDVWIEEYDVEDRPSRTDLEIVSQCNDLALRFLKEAMGYDVQRGVAVHALVDPRAKQAWACAVIAFDELQHTPADEALENVRAEIEAGKPRTAAELEAHYGKWGQHPKFMETDWRRDSTTRLSYWGWVAAQIAEA